MEFLAHQLAIIERMPWLFAALFGLIAGSFLNVVIHRLPRTLYEDPDGDGSGVAPVTAPGAPGDSEAGQRAATTESATACAGAPGTEVQEPAPVGSYPTGLLSLILPRSACPHCRCRIAWYDNIPLLSFVWLRGRCRQCQARISPRYPLIEAFAALACLACVYRFGPNATALAWCVFCLWLIAISAVDFEHMLIPDALSLSGMWLGLLFSCTAYSAVDPAASILGASAGWLLLYSFYGLWLCLTGKAGLGFGDFKLMAMLGAWLGWQALLPVLLYASILGSVFGLALYLHHGRSLPFAFGPWLAVAAMLIVFFPGLARIFVILN